MNIIRSALDWIGWDNVTETRTRFKQINMKLSELAAQLTGIDDKLTEASTEIVAEIQKLKDALGDAEIPAEATAALEAISGKASALADIVPNPPPQEPQA